MEAHKPQPVDYHAISYRTTGRRSDAGYWGGTEARDKPQSCCISATEKARLEAIAIRRGITKSKLLAEYAITGIEADEAKQAGEDKPIPKGKECTRCKGKRRFPRQVWSGGETITVNVECDQCNGTGRRPTKKR